MAALELKRRPGGELAECKAPEAQVMLAMMQSEQARQRDGFIWIDHTYMGGER